MLGRKLLNVEVSTFICFYLLILRCHRHKIHHRLGLVHRLEPAEILIGLVRLVRVLHQLVVALRRLAALAQTSDVNGGSAFEFWQVPMDLHRPAPLFFRLLLDRLLDLQPIAIIVMLFRRVLLVLVS